MNAQYGQVIERPRIVCLCGSTRFSELFQACNFRETLAGLIVLSIGCDTKSDAGLNLTQEDKQRLDELHLRKIDLADEILVINVEGYIGESTAREIVYASERGKVIRWLTLPLYPAYRTDDPQRCGSCCEYSGCTQAPEWVCGDQRLQWVFCTQHVFRFGYPGSVLNVEMCL